MSAKRILVTGAAGGIGRSCAERLLARGDRVVALDRQEITWRGASDTFLPLACDISQTEDCRSAVERAELSFGGLDGLIHCAAIHSSASWEQLEAEELLRVLNVNVGGSFLIAKAAAQAMRKNSTGSIVLTSSSNMITGGVGGAAGMGGPAYVASKAAIVGLVRSLARSLGPLGITINGIVPGVTDTPMIRNYSPEHRAAQELRSPLGRIGTPEDIADVCLFLVSEGARYMTGEMVVVNGGANFG
jgi:3-oxoacyl-[acyl-carrier protein] reductase